tara:strand:- start:3594 stop:4034 length:441 start_codon:yes stop_codon:yes gene_type:complete
MAVRNPSKDKLKSNAVLKEQLEVKCMLEDCDNTLSIYDGPGSNSLCRDHQLECVEYGGMGKPERPWTFYRTMVCAKCGYNPTEDSQFEEIDDEYHRLRVMRAIMHGDHIHLKSQGGANTADNIQTLCVKCHMIKTYKEKDYLGTKQ